MSKMHKKLQFSWSITKRVKMLKTSLKVIDNNKKFKYN